MLAPICNRCHIKLILCKRQRKARIATEQKARIANPRQRFRETTFASSAKLTDRSELDEVKSALEVKPIYK
jgi:hypothetical protein